MSSPVPFSFIRFPPFSPHPFFAYPLSGGRPPPFSYVASGVVGFGEVGIPTRGVPISLGHASFGQDAKKIKGEYNPKNRTPRILAASSDGGVKDLTTYAILMGAAGAG